jgi:hypothetical protein
LTDDAPNLPLYFYSTAYLQSGKLTGAVRRQFGYALRCYMAALCPAPSDASSGTRCDVVWWLYRVQMGGYESLMSDTRKLRAPVAGAPF